jgi:peptide/nickel transport system permease protein
MGILRIVAERIVYGIGLLVAVLVLNFFLIRMAPGDPVQFLIGEMGGASEQFIRDIRLSYGLDRPLLEQLGIYLWRAAQGDLGRSFYYNSPVLDLFMSRVGPTVLLIATATIVSLVAGTVLGVLSSRKPEGWFSAIVTVFSLVGYAAPVFWTGLLLVILFASVLPIFPVQGMRNLALQGNGLTIVLDIAHHLVLPALTLSIIYIAQYSRLARASMLEVLGSDYVRTARAKGVKESRVVFKHALRNAILPIITITGLHFGQLLSGAVLVETVFNWPGLGTLAYDSILRRDYPTILGLLFFAAIMVVVANVVTDLCYAWADPRIKTGRQAT